MPPKTLAAVLSLVTTVLVPQSLSAQADAGSGSERVVIENESWRLVGDLRVPAASSPVPIALLLNGAAGDRRSYAGLAEQLASRGVASLRLDLRGHGESTNLGRFEPGASPHDPLIWDAESDVAAACRYLAALDMIDPSRIGIVEASYSGEEAAEAGRMIGHAALYVLLSPGSLSNTTIGEMEGTGVRWLFVSARDDPFLRDVAVSVRELAPSTELLTVPGAVHGTALLHDEALMERIAAWITRILE
jgi:pimeloyl-ACP methyl ester carboxylesterase